MGHRLLICALCLVILPLVGGCSVDLLDKLVPTSGYVRTTDIAYGQLPRQKLDVYKPEGAVHDASIVIFFYGGHWQSGDRAGYRFVAQALTSQGFIVVIPDYRLYPEVTFPGFVEDGALAIRWVHDNAARFGGEPRNIFLMGHSAGAHIAALLTLDGHYLEHVGLDRKVIRATAALAGPYEFLPYRKDRGAFGMSPADVAPPPETQPMHFANGDSPPLLLISGSADTTVNPANSINLADEIRKRGGDARALIYRHVDHVQVILALASGFRWIAPVLKDASSYFREHKAS